MKRQSEFGLLDLVAVMGIVVVVVSIFIFLNLMNKDAEKPASSSQRQEDKLKLLDRFCFDGRCVSIWCDIERGNLIYSNSGGGVAVVTEGCKIHLSKEPK